MKKNTIRYFLMLRMVCVIVLLVGLCSCDSDRSGTDDSGMFRMVLTPDTTAINKGLSTTKSGVLEEFEPFVQTADYKVAIIQSDDTIQFYERFDQMADEIEIKAGSYRFVAFKGENAAAAFSSPYFEGNSDFTIKENMTTAVNLTCVLANARIKTDFTDDFKAMYETYTVQLSSPYTKDPIEVSQGETRPVYMKVASTGSELGIAIRLKKINETEEKTYTIPAPLNIERRQNIRLIFKTDGASIDNIGLDVLLDNNLTNVTLTAGIPDFMWQQFAKPELTAINFEEGTFEIHSGLFTKDPSATFRAPAGIGGFYIDVWKDDADITNDPEAKSYDLSTSEGAQAAFDDGFVWDEKANPLSGAKKEFVLSLNKAINSLPAPVDKDHYQYTMRIYMRDNLPKSNYTDTLSLTINVKQADAPIIDFPAFSLGSFVEGDTQSSDIKATLLAQSGIDKENSSLSIITDKGEMTINFNDNTNIATLENLGISIKEMSASKTEVTFRKEFSKYLNALATSSQYKFAFVIKEKGEKNRTAQQERLLEVKAPQFSIVSTNGDAFAKRILLRAKMEIGHLDKLYFQYQKSGDGDSWIDMKEGLMSEGISHYIDTLKGLSPLTDYNIRAVYQGAQKWHTKAVPLTTETEIFLPDGQFEDWHSKKVYSSKTLWVGIDIYQWWPYQDGGSSWWTTRNALTNSQTAGTTCYYTSYSGTVPVSNGYSGQGVEISSLGFGEGSTYSQTTGGWTAKKRAAGMFFIGSHSATNNGVSETFNYGHPFEVRPSGFKFNYKFKSISSESFKAYMIVENRENNIITELGRGELISNIDKTSYTEAYVPMHYKNTSLKATHMYIVFLSSTAETPELDVITGSIGEFSGNSDSRFVGNVLTIDNVELIYE